MLIKDIEKLLLKNNFDLKQHSKSFWLTHGNDDLKYLYQSIKERNNCNLIKEIYIDGNTLLKEVDIGKAFSEYYSSLFNSRGGCSTSSLDFVLIAKVIPEDIKVLLIAPITNQEISTAFKTLLRIKLLVFMGSQLNSSPILRTLLVTNSWMLLITSSLARGYLNYLNILS